MCNQNMSVLLVLLMSMIVVVRAAAAAEQSEVFVQAFRKIVSKLIGALSPVNHKGEKMKTHKRLERKDNAKQCCKSSK